MNCSVEPLEKILNVEIANQERIVVNRKCPQCEIEIGGCCVYVDLIPFKLGEFDVILGMDWLSEYEAYIDCKNKRVTLRIPDQQEVVFQGKKQTKEFLTIMQTKRLLKQGCEAYLAHVIDVKQETPEMKDIPVVNEFPDVYPE